MHVKGRYLVLAWVAAFLAACGIVAWRTSAGWRTRRQLDAALRTVNVLESQRADLEARIAILTNREHLGPVVRAMGLEPVSDSDLVRLALPGRR